MAAAAADLNGVRATRGVDKVGGLIKDATQMYLDAFGCLETSFNSGTGYFLDYTGAAGQIFLGRNAAAEGWSFGANGIGKGDQGATQKNPPQVAMMAESELRLGVAVVGTSAVTDQGKLVFALDDQVLTLTRPARGVPVGMVVKWYTSTTCDVLMFGTVAHLTANLAGNGAAIVHCGYFDAANLTTAVDPIQLTIPSRYRVRSIYAVVSKTLAGGTSIVFTFRKGAAAFTSGGVLTLTTNAAGSNVAATAITQDDTTILSESDVLKAGVVVTGTYTADVGGNFNVFAVLDYQLGV